MPTPTVNFNLPPNPQTANPRTLFRSSDGDTISIEQPIRMVSCDTPEKGGYAGNPPVSQPKLDLCRLRLQTGFYNALPGPLRNYLINKLTVDAAKRHIDAGHEAFKFFEQLLETRLTRPDGTRRQLAVIATGEILDRYGRMLAYFAPWYDTKKEPLPPANDPGRRTANLDMVESGWAAFFAVYPSLPKNSDMNLLIAAAERAWKNKDGPWKTNGVKFLLGYEYRMCIKLSEATTAAAGIKAAFQRACVDLRNLKIVGKFDFHKVPPCYRLWVWEENLPKATAELGLTQ